MIVNEYKFDFCVVQHRDDNVLVLEINDGIEIDASMASELTRAADEVMTGSFGILSNRVNSYSLSFEAIAALARYDNMAALAIVIPNNKSRMLVEAQNVLISALKEKPIKIFTDINSADDWLHAVLQTPSQTTLKKIPTKPAN